jgi:hypothetical protein
MANTNQSANAANHSKLIAQKEHRTSQNNPLKAWRAMEEVF